MAEVAIASPPGESAGWVYGMRVGGAIPRGVGDFDAGSVATAHDVAINAQSTIEVRFIITSSTSV
jgi:hypothetical protein